MKRLVTLLLVSMLLVACSSSDTNKDDSPNNDDFKGPIRKIDNSKDWIITENISKYDPYEVYADREDILNALNTRFDDLDPNDFVVQFKRQIDPKRVDAVHHIKLNFESEDSKSIQSTLDSLSAKALEQQNSWDKKQSTTWAQFDILNYTETDSHIFFGTRLYIYAFNSGNLYNEFHSWVIDKNTGKSLTYEEVLKVLDVKRDVIEAKAISKFESWGEKVVTYHGNFDEAKKTQEEALANGGDHAVLVDVGYSVPMLMENDHSKIVLIASRASSEIGIDDPYTLSPFVKIIDK